jgi:hypothetical protein
MDDTILSRRRFIQVGLCGSAVLLIPAAPLGCGDDGPQEIKPGQGGTAPPATEEGRFFDNDQYEAIEALTGLIIPEDEDPGAISARVVDYIDFLLGAFKVDPPRIYAAGPFSGRHGGENGFSVYLPLSRVKEISWRVRIEGSMKAVPDWERLTGRDHIKGLQDIYKDGIEDMNNLSQSFYQADFKDLTPGEQEYVWRNLEAEFRDVAFEHTVEGMYGAPEYGGNAGLVGWKYIHYEGDRQPIGYTRRQMEEPDEQYASSSLDAKGIEEATEFLKAIVRHGQAKHPQS